MVTISLQYVKFSVDNDRRYERVSDLLTLPQIALEDDEFHVNTPTLGLVVPWLDAEIPLDRSNYSFILSVFKCKDFKKNNLLLRKFCL